MEAQVGAQMAGVINDELFETETSPILFLTLTFVKVMPLQLPALG